MKKIILSILFIFINLNATNIDKVPKYSLNYDKTINPYINLEKAIKNAKSHNKNILLLVGGAWCKWCEEFDNTLEDNNNTLAKKLYSSFEVVRIYYGTGLNKETKNLLQQFPVIPGTPHFFILNNDAKLLATISSTFMEKGYRYDKKKLNYFIEKYKKK